MGAGVEQQAPPVSNLQVALSLASRGISVFPVHAGGPKIKQPMPFFRWKDQSGTDERTIKEWWRRWPDAAPAIDLGKSGLFVVDADRHDIEHDGVAAWAALMAEEGASPDGIPIVSTPNDGNHWIFRQDGTLGNGRGRLPSGIDVRGSGGYIVAPGAVMSDGRCYEVFGDPGDAPPVPSWLTKWLVKEGRAESVVGNPTATPVHAPSTDIGSDEIAALLSHIPADANYETWVSALMAVHAATGGSNSGLALADQWSSRGSKYKKGEVARKWSSFRSAGINGATLAALSRQYGADLSAIRIAHMERDEGIGTAEHGREVLKGLTAPRAHGSIEITRLIRHENGDLTDEDGVLVDAIVPQSSAAMADLDYPAGLVGDIARWIVSTAPKPQPALSIAAAITIVGCAAGRQFQGPTGAGTALYVLGLAPTAQGKDTPLKQISRVLNAATMGHHLGPDEFMSFSAVVNTMTRKPLCLAPMDEFGDFMRRVFDRKGSIHARAIPKVFRTLWGANFDMAGTAEWADKESVSLPAPHLSIFGASTHEQFYTALENGAVADGTLNRFLIVEGARRPKRVVPSAPREQVPDAIVKGVRAVYNASGTLHAARRNDVHFNPADHGATIKLGWGAGAEDAWIAFAEEIEARMLDAPTDADLLGRTVEMAARIATIIAAGRGRPEVDLYDIQYGIDLSRRSAETMIAGAADFMAENENEANWQKIVRMIRERGGRLVYRDIYRNMRHMRSRDLKDLLLHMADTGVIGVEDIKKGDGGGHPVRWYRSQN